MKRHPACDLDEWECRAPACSCSVIVNNVLTSIHGMSREQVMEATAKRHVQHVCQDEDCFVCNGGLSWCTVCGGAEASMPAECPGDMMTQYQQDEIQGGRLNFKDGAWQCSGHVASARDPKICGRCGVHIDELRPEE